MRDETDQVTQYLNNFIDQIIDFLPELLGAIAILIIGYIVAKAIAAGIRKLLDSANLNERMHSGKAGNIVQRAVSDPTHLISKIAYWVVFLFAISIAVSVLGIPVLVDFVRAVYSYIPNIIAALLIFLVAGAISGAVATLATKTMGNTPTGKVIATAAPILVMVIATFMILNQLRIAPEIVNATYVLLLGSVALGLALAFGLGGRDVAGRMLDDLYEKGQRNKGQVARDLKQGGNNAKRRANEQRDRL